jgi:hypothetical protein
MTWPDDFLSKVTSFGILGYGVDRIIDLTGPDDPEQFRADFRTPGSAVYKAWRKGKTTGEYNLDKELFDRATKEHETDANVLLDERAGSRRMDDKILENFGI